MVSVHGKKGFTLVEMITVLVILGISIGIFYTAFLMNWQAFEQYIAQADFGQDMDSIVDQINSDGRNAKDIKVVQNAASQQVTFIDPNGNTLGTYTMTNTGEFTINKGQDDVVTTKVDFTNSSFSKPGGGNAFLMILTLTDNILGHVISLSSSTEVYPRNNLYGN